MASISERSSTRRIAAPGGNSTIVLGSEEPEKLSSTSCVEEEKGAEEKLTAIVRCTPGGNSSIGDLLGGEAPALGGEVPGKLTSSNCFASGYNPNSGNVLTDRPSTRLRFAPGGESSIGDLLGQEAPALGNEVTGKLTSNSFANGANPNAGNVLTDRSSTRLHCPPGGNSTIVLGSEQLENATSDQIFEEEAKNTSAAVKCTPGGNSSIGDLLGGEAPALGGEVTGKLTSSNCFASGSNPNSGNMLTERPSTRLRCAPGGESSIGDLLGQEAPALGKEVTGKLTSNSFANGANPNAGNVLTDRSSTRLHCPPGGVSTITLGGDEQEVLCTTDSTRIAPGGVSTIQLGFNAVDETSVAKVSGNRVAPGGVSTIILGGGPPLEIPSARTAPGGVASVVLGDAPSSEQFSHRELEVVLDAPEPTARFPCAPGGNSTLVFGASDEPTLETATRVAPGGPSSIVLGGDAVSPETSSTFRIAPGGETTIVLGDEASTDRFSHRQENQVKTEVPDACPRFPCAPGGTSTIELTTESTPGQVKNQPSGRVAPGGTSTIILGGDSLPIETSSAIRPAPGGEATISLGDDASTDRFMHRQEEPQTTVPDPCPRFPCAPGGNSTIELNTESSSVACELPSGRVAPGGTSTIVLGGESSSDVPSHGTCTRGPVGGETTILLGEVTDAERFLHRETKNDLGAEVPVAAPRFLCAPGGRATINLTTENPSPLDEPLQTGRIAPGGQSSVKLGGDLLPHEMRSVNTNAIAPGGSTTVVLGSDAPAERFSHRETELSLEVPDPTPRFPCAPGGNSTVVLGNDEEMKRPSLTEKVTRATNITDENINIANLPPTNTLLEDKIQTPSKAIESKAVLLG